MGRAYLAISIVTVLWAANFTVAKIGTQEFDPLFIASFRIFVTSAIFYSCLPKAQRKIDNLKSEKTTLEQQIESANQRVSDLEEELGAARNELAASLTQNARERKLLLERAAACACGAPHQAR